MIRIALVEDDLDLRENFVELVSLAADIEICGIYSCSEDLILEYDVLNLDVVVMDIELPGISGIECVLNLKEKKPNVQFLMYTIFENDDKIYDSLCAGATGYLVKSTTSEKLIDAIRTINNGGSPMSEQIARKVIQAFQKGVVQKAKVDHSLSLTDRENEIITFLSKGYRYKEIADRLFLSVETIRTHIRNIYEKLQVSSRTDALNKYYNHTEKEAVKYSGSYLTDKQLDEIIHSLTRLFETEQFYLDSEVSISKVAEKLEITTHSLSQAINSKLKKNFFDYINGWRVEEACRLLNGEKMQRVTIEAIAYDCGFGSKTSFNNAFKKVKDCTPSEWRDRQ